MPALFSRKDPARAAPAASMPKARQTVRIFFSTWNLLNLMIIFKKIKHCSAGYPDRKAGPAAFPLKLDGDSAHGQK
jgi:hypothetical protein